MFFVELQVLPGQWRVLSANHSNRSACLEIGLLRRFGGYAIRDIRVVKVLPS